MRTFIEIFKEPTVSLYTARNFNYTESFYQFSLFQILVLIISAAIIFVILAAILSLICYIIIWYLNTRFPPCKENFQRNKRISQVFLSWTFCEPLVCSKVCADVTVQKQFRRRPLETIRLRHLGGLNYVVVYYFWNTIHLYNFIIISKSSLEKLI